MKKNHLQRNLQTNRRLTTYGKSQSKAFDFADGTDKERKDKRKDVCNLMSSKTDCVHQPEYIYLG